MNRREIKRILILSIPYVVLGLIATNIGEAWRIAKTNVPSSPVLGLMGAFPMAFANFAPSFHPFDLFVGMLSGCGLRLAVYLRGKNAKKYRRNEEYGSARWGTAQDIAPFVAPKFEDNIILTQTERLMMSNRPPNPKNARNKNVLIVGGSGSGKTRFWLKPNLLQCHSSYVVTDPKGSIVVECGNALLKKGQLARRFVLAIPRELPRSQYADLIRDYCREFFVSKGMIADFAIHDKGDGNPHAHILLTMRAMDETGKWLPKSRKVYDLDENGERIRLASGRWKSHKEDTVDWNDQKYAEIWRQGWADTANRYLEAIGSPERLDLRSYARQGIDKIPTVHMGPAVSQLEKKGIQTNIGNLNRDIKAANSLMQSIRQMVRSLKGWLSGLKEKKAALLEALEQAKEPTIPELLSRYLDMRSEERTGWTSKGKLKGTVGDFNKVMEALDFLRQKEISTVESLDAYLDEASAQAVSIREEIRPMEKRVKEIDRLLFHIGNFEANKPVHAEYAAIRWKKPKEKYAADHKEELDAYNAALRYFKVHLDGTKYSTKKLAGEQAQLSENIASKTEALTAVQEDVKILRDVRHWLNQVLPSEQYRQTAEPGKKPSIQQAVKGREQRIREEQAEKRQTPRRQQKQDMEL